MSDEIAISYNFKQGDFQDTLYLDFDTYKSKSKDEIVSDTGIIALKQERYDNWLEIKNTPLVPVTLEKVEQNLTDTIESIYAQVNDSKETINNFLIQLQDLPDAPDWVFTQINSFQVILDQSLSDLNGLRSN